MIFCDFLNERRPRKIVGEGSQWGGPWRCAARARKLCRHSVRAVPPGVPHAESYHSVISNMILADMPRLSNICHLTSYEV